MKHYLLSTLVLFSLFALVGCATGVETEPMVEPVSETVTEPSPEAAEETAVLPHDPTEPAALPGPEPPAHEMVDSLTAVAAEAIAYVQDEQLFIRSLPDGEIVPVHTEPCPEDSYCALTYLKWSPDGQYLLYYYYDGSSKSLRVSDRQGHVQIIEDVAFSRPGGWSPDSRTIVYMKQTDTPAEVTEESFMGGWVYDVWTVAIAAEGSLETPERVGSWNSPGDGCGGGGRSPSEVLYENEGGTSYGYRMGVLEWSAQDILLFNRNCTNIGIGRFDMTTGTELPAFAQPLRNLVLNASGDRWYAATGYAWEREDPENNQLLTGTPDSLDVTVIPTSAKVELVFVGPVSGSLYYTERNQLTREEVAERGLYFGFFEAALWRIQPDGSGEERLLFGAEDHAYAGVTETAVGDLLFVLVENDRPLFAAAQEDAISEAGLQAFMPQRHIVQLPAGGGEPQMVLSNAGQPALLP